MNSVPEASGSLSPLKRALIALQDLRARLESVEAAKREPVAIVGAGCRFPGGVRDMPGYWRLLRNGVDAITEVPRDRWDVDAYYDPDPQAPGKMATRWGAFLDGIDAFDAGFFGISPREAVSMDPQQRVWLEVAWAAIEDAGIPASRLMKSRTGVFAGICSNDYLRYHLADPEQVDAYISSGNAHSVAAGRLSYVLGLRGPSMAVDTACSSSLVAVHLAVQSLRTGESDLALAGGVNLILAPDGTVALSQAQMLSPDGRCRTFDAAAAGYVRGEGCGAVVLKRLSDAERDGDRIWAVIRGSAVNQDGRSNGLTAPNGLAQQDVIRAALANAGVDPLDIDYVEAHGTGTTLGDPMEVDALQAVLGVERDQNRPLLLGSVKTNVGHLETAAGIAGLLKAVLALKHAEIPPHLHFENPSPHIPWEQLPMRIPTSPTAWETAGPRRAGVSSFGYSGTNAHVVLEEAPATSARESDVAGSERPRHILVLSARQPEALRALTSDFADALDDRRTSVPDLAYTANACRSHYFPYRLAATASDATELRGHLRRWVNAGEANAPGLRIGESAKAPDVAFLFTGQGSLYAGMGRRLYESELAYRSAIERCDEILRPLLGRPLSDLLYGEPDGQLDRSGYTQPALFAVEYALAQTWLSWGVRPAALLGHSIGEYVAACLAGVFSLKDGLELTAARGRLMESLPTGGAMAAVFAPESRVREAVEGREDSLSIAAVNGPEEVVISGHRAALEEAAAAFEAAGIRTRALSVSHAFHSPLIEPILREFGEAAARVRYSEPELVVISNRTGCRAETGDLMTPDYWVRQTREAVRFADGVHALAEQGCEVFLEIGPRATLSGLVQKILPDGTAVSCASLRPGAPDWDAILDSVAALYVSGVEIDWAGFDRGRGRSRVDAPAYPFQRRRFWPASPAKSNSRRISKDTGRHPLLHSRLTLPLREAVFESTLAADAPPMIGDHRIQGTVVVPGAVFVEMALAAAAQILGDGPCAIEGIRFEEPLALSEGEGQALQVVVSPGADGEATFEVFRRIPEDSNPETMWRTLAGGVIRHGEPLGSAEPVAALRARCPREIATEAYYERLASLGLDYGPLLRGIGVLSAGAGEVFAQVGLAAEIESEAPRYRLHPALLDAALQALGAAVIDLEDESPDSSFVLAGIGRLQFYSKPGVSAYVHARLKEAPEGASFLQGDVRLLSEVGEVFAEALDVRVQRIEAGALQRFEPSHDQASWTYGLEWITPPQPQEAPESWFRPNLAEISARFQLDIYESLTPEIDTLAGFWVWKALDRLGWRPRRGETFTENELGDRLGVVAEHRRLLARMIEMLGQDGVFERAEEGWRFVQPPAYAGTSPQAVGEEIATRVPGCRAELTLLGRCGEHLADVLRGAVGALPVLFPEGSLALVEKAYAEEPFGCAGNAALLEAIQAALKEIPPETKVRILEIGAGTGGSTAGLLPMLPAGRVEYTFTDVSAVFLRKAREKFGEYSFVEYKLLDIERSPDEQGFDGCRFDIVVAANVLHATRNLRETLANIRRLLEPSGRLMLLEATAPQRKTDLIFGLTGGWWRFADQDLRPNHALLPASGWLTLLAEAGFGAAAAAPDPLAEKASPWSVIVTRPQARSEGFWAIVGNDSSGKLAERLAAVFAGEGERCVCYPEPHGDFGLPAEWRGVVHLTALQTEDQEAICGGALRIAQQLAASERGSTPIWLVTRGAQAARGKVSLEGAAGATLWGLGRTLANEHPELWGGLIDLDPEIDAAGQAGRLANAVLRPDRERQVAFRDGERLAARLRRRPAPRRSAFQVHHHGTYLVTGGLGGLGLAVAGWLARQGAGTLALCGRGEPTAEAEAMIREIERRGARVLVLACDVANREQVGATLARIMADAPPLRGVIHAAGVYDDGVLLRQDWSRFGQVLAPKVDGARNLHELTAGLPLDFFVLFSSASALVGPPGQGSYAAANAYLDAIAASRHRLGLPALAIEWGSWADVGYAAALDPALRERYAALGAGVIPPAEGLACLGSLLGSEEPCWTAVPIDWRAYLKQFPDGGAPSLFEDLQDQRQVTGSAGIAEPGTAWRVRITSASTTERRHLVQALVAEHAARALRVDRSHPLSPREPLQALGLDSLMAVEMRNSLSKVVGRTLPSNLVFDYPTIEALTSYLMKVEWPEAPAAPVRLMTSASPIPAPSAGGEPIAILGAACRIPGGANDLESFWRMLLVGTDAVVEVPPDRWDIDAYYDPDPDAPGAMYTRWGGFLGPVDQFDAHFFGITPREAASMDPQQRLLLEVSYETLENAGQAVERLMGSSTGVFVGISSYDYYHRMRKAGLAGMDAYTGSGITFSVAAGRLAYVLGLQGPTMAVDTACSSSLVTTHLACQSLRNRECDLALAGGVNLMLSPENTVYSCRLRALSPDGRCKTFDAAANGYVRGEGCGMVALKRLSDALRDGDPILAVIRGSAVNQDGRSNGLTAPNGPAQEAVIRKALESGKVDPGDVSYVEAHGTGTPLGDPIELQSLSAVLGPAKSTERPLIVGSVKTNIGHLESAAGITSLIKTALVVQRGEIPPHLHFRERSPFIPWDELPVTIPTTRTPWPDGTKRRIAGVSSFGYSGTNAHAVLEEPPPAPAAVAVEPEPREYLLPISARSPQALKELARAYGDLLAGPEPPSLRDVVYTAASRRSHHEHRLALVGDSPNQIAEGLDRFVETGEGDIGRAHGICVLGELRKVVFVFPGQGSQWLGMGRELLASEPAFAAAIERCDAAVRAETGWSVLSELNASEAESRLGEIEVVQPVLFSVQVALAALWRAWGIEPDVVVGHSMGEVAAAHVAGILSLEDAARIICRRSRLLKRVAGRGAMAVVELSAEEAEQAIAGSNGRLAVAVSNSPRSTVLAGDPAALQSLLDEFESRGVFCRRVKVDVASHSSYVDELRGDLLDVLSSITPKAGMTPLFSTVDGAVVEGLSLGADYWARNLREPVRFGQVVQSLLADGPVSFVEISPHPVLLPAIEDGIRHSGREATVTPSQRRGEPERGALLNSLGSLYTQGVAVDWSRVSPVGRYTPLPNYAWDRQRFWIDEETTTDAGIAPAAAARRSLLGPHVESAVQPGVHLWEQALSLDALPFLRDHRVQGLKVVPAAAYLDLALCGAAESRGSGFALRDVAFEEMLILREDETTRTQLALSGDGGAVRFQILSAQDGGWTLHARGRIESSPSGPTREAEPVAAIQARCPDVCSGAELYSILGKLGLEYGPRFQGVEQVWGGEDEALALIHSAKGAAHVRGRPGIHPALLDSCFHAMGLAGGSSMEELFVPVALRSLRMVGEPAEVRWSHARVTSRTTDGFAADVRLLDEAGRLVVEIDGFAVKTLERGTETSKPAADDWFLKIAWFEQELRPQTRATAGTGRRWLVLADRGAVSRSLVERLEQRGDSCELVFPEEGSALDRLRGRLAEDRGAWAGIVDLSVLNETTDGMNACASTLDLVQALAGTGWRDYPRLWLVTRGAQCVGREDSPAIEQTPLWGLGRTITYEHPELHCAKVDLDPNAPDAAAMLFDELTADDREDQIAFRGGRRYVARLVREGGEPTVSPLAPAAGRSFRLEQRTPGVLDGLELAACDRPEPGPGEVLIEVRSAGLNFLDVLLTLNAIPNDVPAEAGRLALGSECAGRVVALGDGVDGFQVGEEVVAIAPGAFRSHVVAPAALAAPKSASLSYDEAATIPIAFLTAWYALRHVARLQPGERVLIQAASGGVGLAALQIAQQMGAEIFATAGSDEKREHLRALGVRHVADSRSLAFAAEIREATGGEGVDVVLNSLAGEFIDAGLGLLREHGRFVEIGKRDSYADRPIGLRPFLRNLSFSLVDLRGMTVKRPGYIGELFREVMQEFRAGRLRPLPVQTFRAGDVLEAFRWMAEAKHVGKVVVSFAEREQTLVASGTAKLFRGDRSYLITGGLGGLGLVTARWMCSQGARHLALLGRSAPGPEAAHEADALRETGAEIRVIQADVSDEGSLGAALSDIYRSMPPLAGVIHAAGLLDDGLLAQQTRERFEKVAAPKIRGAWNLHALLEDRPLDFFVLYSSGASVLGSPGQGNYAAANAYLDALAHYRRAQGLPAMSINWGAWAGVGLAAAESNRGERIAMRGFASLSPEEGVGALDRSMRENPVQIAVLPLNLRQWLQSYPQLAQAPLVEHLLAGLADGATKPAAAVRAVVAAAPASERPALVEDHVHEQLAKVVRLSKEKIERRTSFKSLGLDSLMALELRNRLEAALGLTLPAAVIWGYPTVTALSEYLLAELNLRVAEGGRNGSAPVPPAAPTAVQERIAELSDDEVDRLLAARLAKGVSRE